MITTDDAFDTLAAEYSNAALLLLLEETAPGEFEGIAGAAVYCSGPPLSHGPVVEHERDSRDKKSKLKTLIIDVSPEEARAFVAGLYSGKVSIPGTDYVASFHLEGSESGFTSSASGGWNDTGENVRLLGSPHWSRRHRSTIKRLDGKDLTEATVVDLVASLPQSLPTRLNPLDLEWRLEALGDFFELLEPPVQFDVTRTDAGMHYELLVRLGSDQDAFTLFVRTHRSNMLVSSEVFDVAAGGGQIPLPADFGRIDYELLRGGIFVDSYTGNFIDALRIAVGVCEPPVTIDLDGSGQNPVSIDRAPSHYLHVPAGKSRSKRPPFNAAALAAAKVWRDDQSSGAAFAEHVFTDLPPASRIEGLRYLADLVAHAVTATNATQIHLVDQYGIDVSALLRVAAAAAKVTGGTVKLLTRNLPPPLPPGAASPAIPDYDDFARRVARRFGVTIERYVPSRDVHDRYIWIGDRMWHVGHSYNQLGSDVSAIIEIRSSGAKRALRSVLEPEFAGNPVALYK